MMNLRHRFIWTTFALAAGIAVQPSHTAALPQALDPDAVATRRAAADSLFAAGEFPAAREAYGEVAAAWRQAVAAGYRKTSALHYMAIAQGDMGDMAAAYATLDCRLGLVLRADWFPRFAPVAADRGAPQVVRATIGGGTTTAPRLSFYVLPED